MASPPIPRPASCRRAGLKRVPARKQQPPPANRLALARFERWGKRCACATRITGNSSRGSRALCAGGHRRIPIIFDLRSLGRWVSDEFTVPVCRIHHRELHRHADEAAWWGQVKIDPLPVALRLWQQTRRNAELAAAGKDLRCPAAGTPDMSVQNQPNSNSDLHADGQNSVSKNADGLTGR
jgi:hypothetical protein